MHRPDKAPEPSMEEILASIRKIIAEEPIGSRPGPAPRGPGSGPGAGEQARADSPALPMPARDDSGSDGPPYSVEDALADLIDDTPPFRTGSLPGKDDIAPKPPARPAAGEDDDARPSWLFGRSGGPAPVQPPAGAPAGNSRASGVLGQLGSLRPSTAERAPAGEGAAAKPIDLPKPAEPARFDRPREAPRPAASDAGTLPSGQHQDLPKPAPARVPFPPAGQREGLPAAAAPGSPSVARPAPAPQQPGSRPSEPAPDALNGDKAEKKPAAAEQGPQLVERMAARPGGERVSKPSPAAAVEPAPSKTEPLREPLIQQPPAAAQIPAAEPGNSRAEAPPASGAAVQSPRTLEDTVADLLRPMLREWLDANMPRIVEKALRVELAASAKRPGADDPR